METSLWVSHLQSVAPAVRNAILNATGVHMNVSPMTAQRLIEKFKEKGLI